MERRIVATATRIGHAMRRRMTNPGYLRSVVSPDPVRLYGIGNERHRSASFRTLELFRQGLATRTPVRRILPSYLVALNHLDEEFVDFAGPRVFCTYEPPMFMTDETKRLLGTAEVAAHWYRGDDPDPARRMVYPVLRGLDPAEIAGRLAPTVAAIRPHLCSIVARYARNDAPESLLDERLAVVEAFGGNIDIFGHPGRDGTNRWTAYDRYRGPVDDKIATLRSYTFTVAYENADVAGYVTEKMLDALRAGSIPLYRGGGGLAADLVPPDCYVDCNGLRPGEVVEIAQTMSHDEVMQRREAAVRFFSSSAALRFTAAHWRAEVAARLAPASGTR
ncbi:MAG: glycosyltransferase family 10 [Acidimicrobiales bacterium]